MKKVLKGKVVSVKMKQTAVVEVVSKRPHPLYQKLLTRSKKYLVDTAEMPVSLGEEVLIVETVPISKHKHFKVQQKVTEKENA